MGFSPEADRMFFTDKRRILQHYNNMCSCPSRGERWNAEM